MPEYKNAHAQESTKAAEEAKSYLEKGMDTRETGDDYAGRTYEIGDFRVAAVRIFQNAVLMMRMMSSSGENTVNKRGKRGAVITTASREISLTPKGTIRISRTTA